MAKSNDKWLWCIKCRKYKCSKNDIHHDFDVQNVGNRNVEKRQKNDFGGQNVGNRNV
jgi:hypothetical protein